MAHGRLLQPKSADHHHASSTAGDGSAEQKSSSSKRKCVPTACIPCRRRKSKCDGGIPICSTCVAVYKTECSYEKDLESRSRPPLKRNSSSVSDNSSSGTSDILINHLKTLSESEAIDLVGKIRKEDRLDSLAESLRYTNPQSRPGSSNADWETVGGFHQRHGDLSSPKRLRLPDTGPETVIDAVDVLRPMSSTAASLVRQNGSWTKVTSDTSYVRHLLRLYFTWQHSFLPLFSEKHFYQDMELSRDTYCSSLLVNAICAFASSYSDIPLLRKESIGASGPGDLFFEEAKSLLFEDGSSRLATVQALAIMGLREASLARESVAFQYVGQCVRMAVDLGLHLPVEQNALEPLSQEHFEAHRMTFWGCFALDNAFALFSGRLPQLPLAAVGVEKPTDQGFTTQWIPYNDVGMQHSVSDPSIPSYYNSQQLFRFFCSLGEVVNDTLFFYHAPKERLTARRVLDRYAKYRTWFKSLPPNLMPSTDSTPQVYLLHMYYFACVIHLFRPLVLFNLANSPISPREVCIESANQISELVVNYTHLFSLRCSNLFIANILQTACTVHLLNMSGRDISKAVMDQNQRSQQNFTRDIRYLSEISANHVLANQSVRILTALLEKSGLEAILADLNLEPSTPHSNRYVMRFISPSSSDSGASSKGLDGRSQVSPKGDRLRSPDLRAIQLSHLTIVPAVNPIPSTSSTQPNAEVAAAGASSYFWTPFPGQGVPLVICQAEKDPMALASMLENAGLLEQLRNDGFIYNAMSDSEMTMV